eukprot:11194257-Lingulodinium_polyedra.AAC.1
MRVTEVSSPLPLSIPPAMEIDDAGAYDIAIDAATDGRDLWELVTGAKGVPQDKLQRLVIMALRERRL